MSMTRLRPSIFAAAVFTLAIAGCDSRELLAPNGRSPVTARSYITEPQTLGSGFLAAPPNTSPASVANIGWDPLQSFPDSAWVVVNVTGNIHLTYNQAPCDTWAEAMPVWACMTGDPFDGFGAQPWDGGTVSIRAYYDGGGGGYTAVKLRGSGGTGAVGLFFAPGAGSLAGRYNMRALWAWDPTFGTGPWSYNIAGGYTVSATAVPAPFQVTESAPDADGVVTYTVEPLYGLQLTTPVNGWPDGATFWAFYPGDSLSDRPDRSWPGWQIAECQFQLVCRWRPPVAGRMQVLAHLEGQTAYARSSSPTQPPQCGRTPNGLRGAFVVDDCSTPFIEVVCTPNPVPRGATVQCEANAKPHGDLQVTKWWFDDGAGHIIRSNSADEDSSFFWGGPVVVGGTVHAEGTIDGKVAPPGTGIFAIIPRDWRIHYPEEPAPIWEHGDSLVYPPVHTYGEKIGDGVFGKFWGGAVNTLGAKLPPVGPNAGVSYFISVSVDGPLEIRVNGGLQQDDPWYRAQRGRSPTHPNGCGREFLDREARQVPVHESGHYAISRDFWTSKSTADSFERAVVFPPEPTDALVALRDSLVRDLKARQAQHDSTDFGIQDCDPYPLPRR